MKYITKVKLQNFKKFKSLEIDLNKDINIIIGDNEAGKSSILLAIDLVLRGSRNKIESLGLENLFNKDVIRDFMATDRDYNQLPNLSIEIFLHSPKEEALNGENNSEKSETEGLRLRVFPNDDYSDLINYNLRKKEALFPFEYYSMEFATFAGREYNGYSKHIKHILIDNSNTNAEYAMRDYVKEVYNLTLSNREERLQHYYDYRTLKDNFNSKALKNINDSIEQEAYSFALKNNSNNTLENELTILDNNIPIENKGRGNQTIIKTKLALSNKNKELDVLLFEEPENHLSHTNTRKLIEDIKSAAGTQIIITTHNNLIATRLDLRKCILLNSSSKMPVMLSNLSIKTADFFIKSPNSILQYILSPKAILVEGNSEFLLMDKFAISTLKKGLSELNIDVIPIGGKFFFRYLELAKLLDLKTCVITDNDGNNENTILDKYSEYTSPKEIIKIFCSSKPEQYTFEVCIYEANKELCEVIINEKHKVKDILKYMLEHKTEVSYHLLSSDKDIVVPEYIEKALQWISH